MWWIPEAEMLRDQSSHKNLWWLSLLSGKEPIDQRHAECELRPNTPWAIINPDKFSFLSAKDTNRADLTSQSQTHPYLAESKQSSQGEVDYFSILPVHSWESSLPIANYIITVIWNNNVPHFWNSQLAKTSKYSRKIKMILKVWVILPQRMHRKIIQTEKKMYMTLWASSISCPLSWNEITFWLLQIKKNKKQHRQSHTLNVSLTADACGQ